MSKLKGFTLIELIIVVILVGVSSYIVISNIKKTLTTKITPSNLQEIFYPNGELYISDENIIFSTSGIKNIQISNPEVYDKNLNKIEFSKYKDKDIIFKYSIKNGLQNSYILNCDEGVFVFKPLKTIKVSSLDEAQEILTLKNFKPTEGDYFK